MRSALPRTAKDVFQLSTGDRLIYGAVITLARCTRMWRYPISASGDLETMRRKDKIYWLYKAQFPIAQPMRGAGLEQYFNSAADFRWSLPPGFVAASELQLSAVGDLMDHAFLPNSAGIVYENVFGSIFEADISIANLECVLAATGSEPFRINPYEGAPLRYRPGSFDAVKGFCGRKYSFMSTACNHSLDAGEPGVLATIETLKAEGIAFNGMNETADTADEATIVHKNGFTIALLSHTFGLNAKKPPKEKPWLINRTNLNDRVGDIDFSQIEKQIYFAHSHGADATIALLHWGMEHEYYPRPEQLEVAHHLAEMGIDIVVGHHAHVVQPMECYRTKRDPERVVPIFYSLGNLLTPFSHPSFRQSAVARIKLTKGTCRDGSVRTYVAHTNTVEVFQEIDESTETTWLTARN